MIHPAFAFQGGIGLLDGGFRFVFNMVVDGYLKRFIAVGEAAVACMGDGESFVEVIHIENLPMVSKFNQFSPIGYILHHLLVWSFVLLQFDLAFEVFLFENVHFQLNVH
jgi:hypothetical protein